MSLPAPAPSAAGSDPVPGARLSRGALGLLGLQHVLVMYAGAVAVPLIVGRALELSPEQVTAQLRIDYPNDPEMRLNHESIYQALYVQGRGELRRDLHKRLRLAAKLDRCTVAQKAREVGGLVERPFEPRRRHFEHVAALRGQARLGRQNGLHDRSGALAIHEGDAAFVWHANRRPHRLGGLWQALDEYP